MNSALDLVPGLDHNLNLEFLRHSVLPNVIFISHVMIYFPYNCSLHRIYSSEDDRKGGVSPKNRKKDRQDMLLEDAQSPPHAAAPRICEDVPRRQPECVALNTT
jgi:hypothetical protein